jgi:hypothetical protein
MTDEEVESSWYTKKELREKRSSGSSKNVNKYAGNGLFVPDMEYLMAALSVVQNEELMDDPPMGFSGFSPTLRRKKEYPLKNVENSPIPFLRSPTKPSKRKWLKQQPK